MGILGGTQKLKLVSALLFLNHRLGFIELTQVYKAAALHPFPRLGKRPERQLV